MLIWCFALMAVYKLHTSQSFTKTTMKPIPKAILAYQSYPEVILYLSGMAIPLFLNTCFSDSVTTYVPGLAANLPTRPAPTNSNARNRNRITVYRMQFKHFSFPASCSPTSLQVISGHFSGPVHPAAKA